MSIPWEYLGRQKFEDMVSVLLSRLHPDSQRIDGKGGDGGRDVQIVHSGDSSVIDAFELKSFTGRMGDVQRQQVKRSLNRVAGLRPLLWTLVVPIDPTPGELEWFCQLGKDYSFPLQWRGKTWLDGKMAAHPDIRRYFLEDTNAEVVQLLLELNQEQAIVTDANVVMNRLRVLHERLNEIDPYYKYQLATVTGTANNWPSDVVFSVRKGDARVDAYAKYRGAVKDRPISIRAMVTVGPEDLTILEPLDYGLETTIPHRMISSVTVDLPSRLGGSFSGGEFNIFPVGTELDDPITLSLRVMAEDMLVASYPVQLKEHNSGPKGSVFTGTDSTGWLIMRLKVDVVNEGVEAEFQVNPRSAMPNDLVPLFQWLGAFQPGRRLNIRWPEGLEVNSEIGRPFWATGSPVELVEALAYLQERTGVYWEMPLSLGEEDAQEIVAVAALMRGETIDLRWKAFSFSMNQWEPELQKLEDGRAQAFLFYEDISLSLHGGKVPIGRVQTHVPSARPVDCESVKKDLASGLVPTLRLVPGDSDKAQRVLVP